MINFPQNNFNRAKETKDSREISRFRTQKKKEQFSQKFKNVEKKHMKTRDWGR